MNECIGVDKQTLMVNLYFFYLSIETCFLGTQNNLLIETVLLSTHSIFLTEK